MILDRGKGKKKIGKKEEEKKRDSQVEKSL